MQPWSQKNSLSENVAIGEQTYRTGGRKHIRKIGGCRISEENSFIQNVFISKPPFEERFAWLFALEADFASEVEADEIAEVYYQIDLLTKPDLCVELDELIHMLETINVSHEIKAAILCYTFKMKARIPQWNNAFCSFKEELEDHGYDAKEILLGIM